MSGSLNPESAEVFVSIVGLLCSLTLSLHPPPLQKPLKIHDMFPITRFSFLLKFSCLTLFAFFSDLVRFLEAEIQKKQLIIKIMKFSSRLRCHLAKIVANTEYISFLPVDFVLHLA